MEPGEKERFWKEARELGRLLALKKWTEDERRATETVIEKLKKKSAALWGTTARAGTSAGLSTDARDGGRNS